MADCERCGHDFDPHRLCGTLILPQYTNGVEVPVAGWIECQEDDCLCWSTWAIEHPDLEPALIAIIDQYLKQLQREHEAEADEIVLDAYEEGLMTDQPWALQAHEYRRRRRRA